MDSETINGSIDTDTTVISQILNKNLTTLLLFNFNFNLTFYWQLTRSSIGKVNVHLLYTVSASFCFYFKSQFYNMNYQDPPPLLFQLWETLKSNKILSNGRLNYFKTPTLLTI